MACEITNPLIIKLQEAIPNQGVATEAYLWATNKNNGTNESKVNKAISQINEWVERPINSKSDANKLLSELKKAGLLKSNSLLDNKLISNYGMVAEFILKDKSPFIQVLDARVSDRTATPRFSVRINSEYKPPVVNEALSAEVQKDINLIGTEMLGVTLMSMNNIVKLEQQNETVDTIAEKIAREVIGNGSITQEKIQSIFNGYYNAFLKTAKGFKDNGVEAGFNHVNEYLKNWTNLESLVINKLKSRSGLNIKGGITNTELQSVNGNAENNFNNNAELDGDEGGRERTNFSDDFSVTLDSKDTISTRLKLFLASIKSGKKHYLTKEDLHVAFDEAYNTLSATLSDTEPIWDGDQFGQKFGMKQKLLEYSVIHPWMKDLVSLIDEQSKTDGSIRNEFVVAMNKHYIQMDFIMHQIKESMGSESFKANVWSSNANSLERTILQSWKTKLMNSNEIIEEATTDEVKEYNPNKFHYIPGVIIRDELGNAFYDAEKLNMISYGLEMMSKDKSLVTEENIQALFASLGIDFSPKTIKSMFNTGIRYRKSNTFIANNTDTKNKYNKELFDIEKGSQSPIAYLYRSINKILSASASSNSNIALDQSDGSKYDLFSDASFNAFVNAEAKHSLRVLSNSYRDGNKTVYSYTNDKYIVDRFADLMRGINDGDWSKIDELNNDIFASNSSLLAMLNDAKTDLNHPIRDVFGFTYVSLDPLKERGKEAANRGLSDMSPKELIMQKINFMYNNMKQFGKDDNPTRVGKLFYPTTSDKTTTLLIQTILKNGIKYTADGTGKKSIDRNTVKFIYDTIVKSEINRMHKIQKLTANYATSTNISGYDEGSKYFYSIPMLNGVDSLFNEVNGQRILKANLNDLDIQEIQNVIAQSMNEMIESQINQFKEVGVGYDEKTSQIKYISSDAVEAMHRNMDNATNKDVSDQIAADFAVNYFINNMNMFQLFIGDFANFHKMNKKSADYKAFSEAKQTADDMEYKKRLGHVIVESTFDNIGKRLAGDLAPGYEADYSNVIDSNGKRTPKTSFKVSMSQDIEHIKSTSEDYINKVFRLNEQNRTQEEKEAILSWSKANMSDAQSWSSLDFFLDTMYSFGSKYITEKDYQSIKKKLSDFKKSKRPYSELNFSDQELGVVLQPIKPVYVNNKQQSIGSEGDNIGVRTYIKTSTFPLIPQLVKGTDLQSISEHMNENGIDVHVFISGTKVGAPAITKNDMGQQLKGDDGKKMLKIFNEDGSVNSEGVKLMNANSLNLDIKGLKIQQDVPYHEHPGEVNVGSQESSLLFSNIRGLNGFSYNEYFQDVKISKEISNIFKSNKDISSVGNQRQYAKYLESIFPNSEVKDVVYHTSLDTKISKFNESKIGIHFGTEKAGIDRIEGTQYNIDFDNGGLSRTDIFYKIERAKENMAVQSLGENFEMITTFPSTYDAIRSISKSYPALLNIKNLSKTSDIGDDSQWIDKMKDIDSSGGYEYSNKNEDIGSKSYVVKSSDQIHLLGSKQDIELFTKFVEENPDKDLTGEQLEGKYNRIYKDIYQKQLDGLKKEIYDSNGKLDIKALQKILMKEAISKGYSVNDIYGLGINDETGKFRSPLWSLPSAHKYESLIMSIVDSRVRKLKLPGNSFVLGSEAGFRFKTAIKDTQADVDNIIEEYGDQIIFTDHFDHSQGKLLSMRPDANDNSKMLGSQVFIPVKLKGADGHFIDLRNYTKTITLDGTDGNKITRTVIDSERLPNDLLKLFGFRIPTQGHNSMASIEIAGFLPEACGDLMIASQDFTVQMGSDKR